ncbi:hypothetical protein ACH4UM_19780 [Streptomyces sp. NPDC020801]|uniref:hypothetical protein n=1 Tax=unclassified Streptomyces TaxID=2593676 RepID=UPI0037B3FFDD
MFRQLEAGADGTSRDTPGLHRLHDARLGDAVRHTLEHAVEHLVRAGTRVPGSDGGQ